MTPFYSVPIPSSQCLSSVCRHMQKGSAFKSNNLLRYIFIFAQCTTISSVFATMYMRLQGQRCHFVFAHSTRSLPSFAIQSSVFSRTFVIPSRRQITGAHGAPYDDALNPETITLFSITSENERLPVEVLRPRSGKIRLD